jgi:hemin uptake protein HemP
VKTPPADRTPSKPADTAPPAAALTRRHLNSADLLGCAREIQIEHAGELYTLRQTRKGKLLLTK